MAPNSPACSFIHASMAGSRSTAPLNRSNSVLIVDSTSAFEICGHVAPLPYLTLPHLPANPSSGTVVLVEGVSLPDDASALSEAPSNHPYNCQCRIVGLVSLGELIHRTED